MATELTWDLIAEDHASAALGEVATAADRASESITRLIETLDQLGKIVRKQPDED